MINPHVASLLPPEGVLSRLEAARRRLRRLRMSHGAAPKANSGVRSTEDAQ